MSLVDGYRSDRLRVSVEDRFEGSTAVGCLPHPAPGAADIEYSRIACNGVEGGDAAAGDRGSDVPRLDGAKTVRVQLDAILSSHDPHAGREACNDKNDHQTKTIGSHGALPHNSTGGFSLDFGLSSCFFSSVFAGILKIESSILASSSMLSMVIELIV